MFLTALQPHQPHPGADSIEFTEQVVGIFMMHTFLQPLSILSLVLAKPYEGEPFLGEPHAGETHLGQLEADLMINIQPFLARLEGIQVVELREGFSQVWVWQREFIMPEAFQHHFIGLLAGRSEAAWATCLEAGFNPLVWSVLVPQVATPCWFNRVTEPTIFQPPLPTNFGVPRPERV
jgi:hypothetical protein